MARPWGANGGPSDERLRQLVEVEGMTDRQIAEQYNVAENTVRYWRKRASIERDSPERIDHRAEGAIPWELNTAAGHHMDPLARLLRARNRLRHGLDVPADVRRRIEKLEEDLEAENLVLDYNRVDGFITRPRDPKLDRASTIVRIPQEIT